jgi:hypothetical protein
MKEKYQTWAAFAVSFLAVGLPYWLIPYKSVNLPDALIAPGLLVVCAAALLLRALRIAPLWRTAAVIGAAVPAAVFARVVVEGLQDPTSHNLWPLEIVIAAALGFVWALAGAIIGTIAARFKP